MLWVEKYRPSNLRDIVAGKTIVDKVKKWAESWKKHRKPLLLGGPPGTGKTSMALALASTYGWEAVELNASDQRSWQIINRVVGEGAFNETISDEGEFLRTTEGKRKVIILDEVDNIHKKEDAGGEGALIKIIKRKPPQPIILIANDPYALSRELRSICEFVSFRRIDYRSVVKVLREICRKEGIKADIDALTLIAKNSGGDLRAAINDLQAAAEGKDHLSIGDVVTATRTQETDIFRVIQKIFKSFDPEVYSKSMLLDESPEDIIWWVSENVPLEYRGEDLLKASLVLSRADIFLGRVRRRQFYRLWKYAGYLMTVGVQQSKKEPHKGFTRYRRPAIWQRMMHFRGRREKLRKILAKIGKASHLSQKKAYSELYFLIKTLISGIEVERAARISVFYDFDADDIEFMTGDAAKAEAIMKYIDEHNLHRVDESFLSGFEEGPELEEKEIEEKPETDLDKQVRKPKDATLDLFFD
jgi:replication factor C large subunit